MPYEYVIPNATVYLLKDIPLNEDYIHTVLYEKGAQETLDAARLRQKNDFVKSPYLVKTLTGQMYKRVNKNTLKVTANYDEVYMCNYMVFQNHSAVVGAEHKFYYAFILEVNYISEGTCQIVYQIDVMQTWAFDYELLDCFVEREHADTDVIGSNTIPESVTDFEYVLDDTGTFQYEPYEGEPTDILNGEYSIVVVAPWEVVPNADNTVYLNKSIKNGFYGNVFSGLVYNAFSLASLPSVPPIAPYLNYVCLFNLFGMLNQTEMAEIVAIYIVPTNFVYERNNAPSPEVAFFSSKVSKSYSWKYLKNGNLTKPKNNKLYTYPYNMLTVTTSDGTSADYKYERFCSFLSDPNQCLFRMYGTMGCPPEIKLVPDRYMLSEQQEKFLEDQERTTLLHQHYDHWAEALTLQNYPLCPWVTDTFKAWLAQNATRAVLTMAQDVGGMLVGNYLGDPSMVTDSSFNLGRHTANSIKDLATGLMTKMPKDSHGVSGAMLGATTGELGFRYYKYRLKDEYAAIIDNYFDMYGYATKRVKKPNRDVRQYWCYTQTQGCAIKGVSPTGLPAQAENEITKIYNSGITFWKTMSNIGNYASTNYPINEIPNNNQQ